MISSETPVLQGFSDFRGAAFIAFEGISADIGCEFPAHVSFPESAPVVLQIAAGHRTLFAEPFADRVQGESSGGAGPCPQIVGAGSGGLDSGLPVVVRLVSKYALKGGGYDRFASQDRSGDSRGSALQFEAR
jgi:hypothetical protein